MSAEFKAGNLDALIELDIDAFGLQHTIQRLELICLEKSAHILTNGGDKQLAREWQRFGVKLKQLSQQAGRRLQ